MFKVLFLFIPVIFCISSHFVLAQKQNDSIRFTSLMLGSDYTTNNSTFGKFSSYVKQPSVSPFLSFDHKSGLLISTSVNIIANSDSSSSQATYQFNPNVGFQFFLTPDITLTPAFTYYIYGSNSLTINALYQNFTELDFSIDKEYWFTSISGGYLSGRISEFNVDAQIGCSYSWDGLFSKNDALMIQGKISSFFNNPNYLSKLFHFLKDYADIKPFATRDTLLLDLVTNQRLDPAVKEIRDLRQLFRNDQQLRWLARDYIPYDITLSKFLQNNNRFTITTLAISLPITYMIGNFSLNMEVSFYKMINQPIYFKGDTYFYFSAGICYSFDW